MGTPLKIPSRPAHGNLLILQLSQNYRDFRAFAFTVVINVFNSFLRYEYLSFACNAKCYFLYSIFFYLNFFIFRVFLCPCIWRPKVIVVHLPLVPSTLFIETWSLIEPEPFWFHQIGYPANLKNPRLCLLNCDYWHSEKAFYWLSSLTRSCHSPIHCSLYKNKSVPKLENLRTLILLKFLYIINTSLSSLRTSSMRPNCKAHFFPLKCRLASL